jgi:acid phosphatase family membrane protein YuiD
MSPVVLVLFVGFCIQAIKIIIDTIRCRTCLWQNFFSSGGFPSFHTGISSSVTTLILLHYGVDSYFFAFSLAISLLFAYDAMNLRYEAGQHAQYINSLTKKMSSNA